MITTETGRSTKEGGPQKGAAQGRPHWLKARPISSSFDCLLSSHSTVHFGVQNFGPRTGSSTDFFMTVFTDRGFLLQKSVCELKLFGTSSVFYNVMK